MLICITYLFLSKMFIIVVFHLFLPAKSERFLVGSKWVFVLKSDTGRSEEIWSCIGYLDAPAVD